MRLPAPRKEVPKTAVMGKPHFYTGLLVHLSSLFIHSEPSLSPCFQMWGFCCWELSPAQGVPSSCGRGADMAESEGSLRHSGKTQVIILCWFSIMNMHTICIHFPERTNLPQNKIRVVSSFFLPITVWSFMDYFFINLSRAAAKKNMHELQCLDFLKKNGQCYSSLQGVRFCWAETGNKHAQAEVWKQDETISFLAVNIVYY